MTLNGVVTYSRQYCFENDLFTSKVIKPMIDRYYSKSDTNVSIELKSEELSLKVKYRKLINIVCFSNKTGI